MVWIKSDIIGEYAYVAYGCFRSNTAQIVRVDRNKLIDETDLLPLSELNVVLVGKDVNIDCCIICRDNNYMKYRRSSKPNIICKSVDDLEFLKEYNINKLY